MIYCTGLDTKEDQLGFLLERILFWLSNTNHGGPTLDDEPKPTPIHFYVFFPVVSIEA